MTELRKAIGKIFTDEERTLEGPYVLTAIRIVGKHYSLIEFSENDIHYECSDSNMDIQWCVMTKSESSQGFPLKPSCPESKSCWHVRNVS